MEGSKIMDANVSDAVRVAEIAAESNETIVMVIAFMLFMVAMFWSV